tara:strand:+ start:623 stop:1201 length:579 start_codon:yes stop_codon:yes gene_type:complete
MKKLLLILLCLPLIGLGQYNKEEVQMIDGIAYYKNKIFKSSLEMIYYEDGELFKDIVWGDGYGKPGTNDVDGIAYYNNKIFTGTVVQYEEDGKLFKEITFKDGKKDGLYRRWKSRSYYEGNYKDGEWDGLFKRWRIKYEDGFEGSNQNVRQDGIWKTYHKENGQLKYESNYKNGELISQKCWDVEGNKIDCE